MGGAYLGRSHDVGKLPDLRESRSSFRTFVIFLHLALRHDDPDAEIGLFEPDERVTIDGKFDLARVAKRLVDYVRSGASD